MELSPNSLTLPFKFCFPTVASLLLQDSLHWFCLHITCSSPPESNSTNRWYLWDSARQNCACDFCPFDIILSFFKRQQFPSKFLQDFLFVFKSDVSNYHTLFLVASGLHEYGFHLVYLHLFVLCLVSMWSKLRSS